MEMTHIRVNVAFRLMSCRLMSPSALRHSQPYVVRLNVAFRLMSFGIMSHSALCRIQPYVVWLCVVRRIVVRRNVVLPTVGVSNGCFGKMDDLPVHTTPSTTLPKWMFLRLNG